jgi:predicted membrane chloride channel (bestrophin family)
MARTFMFLYVFTIPFVLLGDQSSIFAHCFMVFLLTYGFVGLETVSIELDNPFGDDPNDFDNEYVPDVHVALDADVLLNSLLHVYWMLILVELTFMPRLPQCLGHDGL